MPLQWIIWEIKPHLEHQQEKQPSAYAQRAFSNSTPTPLLSFLWILSRPAIQQLNLQTALNYLTCCGTRRVHPRSGCLAPKPRRLSSCKVSMEIGSLFNDTTSDAMSLCSPRTELCKAAITLKEEQMSKMFLHESEESERLKSCILHL